MSIVIATNNTGNQIDIDDLGISLAAAEVKPLSDYFDFVDLTESDDLKVFVGNGDITINDGSNDLSIIKGLEHLDIESVHEDFIQDAGSGGVINTTSAVAGAARNTSFQIPLIYTDTTYISEEYHSDRSVVEWVIGQPTRITIKSDGLYRVSTCYFVRANNPNFISSYFRITVNGVAYENESHLNTYTSEIQQVVISYSIPLVAGDYLTSQCRRGGSDDIDVMASRFSVFKLDAVQGPAGPPGGTTIDTQDNGSTITTNTSILNFQGNGVVVTDAGSNKANITINNNSFETKYIQVYDSVGLLNVNSTTPVAIPFDTQEIRDTDTFNHSTIVNKTRITVLQDGWYDVSYTIGYDGDNSRKNILGSIRKNGTTILKRTYGASYTRNNTDDYGTTQSSGSMIELVSGDYVELIALREGTAGSVITYADVCWLNMKFVREA